MRAVMKAAKTVFIPKRKITKVSPTVVRFFIPISVPKTLLKKASRSKGRSIFKGKTGLLRRGTREDYIYNGSFHQAIAPVLVLAQCFAVMPVVGIRSQHATDLQFQLLSGRCIYSIVVFCCVAFNTILTINWTLKQKLEFDKVVPSIFYTSNLYVLYCFGKLASRWPAIMRQWTEVEKQLPVYKTEMEKAQLAYKIKMITMVIMTLSLSEHLLSVIVSIHYANYCPSVQDPIESFFRTELSQLFVYFEYHPMLALYGKTVNVICTFVWNFMDVFVMLVSVGLSSRFKQIYENLKRVKGLAMPEEFWMKSRNEYRMMCELCEEIDNAMAHITMVSFSNNLFFICVQLLNSLNTMSSFAHALYFWFSLLYLIGRTLAVSLYSAQINDESKKPIEVFRVVPRDSWCQETKRFTEEVTNDVVALSGMKFFYLTRKLLLSVAGTIATYELVLIQFHQEEEAEKSTACR